MTHFKSLDRIFTLFALLIVICSACVQEPSKKRELLSYALPYEHSTEDSLQEATCYFIRGTSAHLSKVEGKNNYYLLSMQIPDAIISFGGLASTSMNAMNSLIFFNQWPQQTFGSGGLIVFNEDQQHLPRDRFLNILVSSSTYDPSEHIASFILVAQEPLTEFFLNASFPSCLLVVQTAR
jgi:hypothetical protein